jgi:putative redox protein
VTITNAEGHELAAKLELPVGGRPVAFALFAHCFTCSKDVRAAAQISRALAAEGIAVLRFDFTGLGESEGEFAATTFATNVSDLVAAAEYLAAEWQAPRILVGHSLGGAAVLQAAARIPSSVAVATIGAPASPVHVTKLLAESTAEIEARGEATVELAGRPFRIRREFLDDLDAVNMQQVIAGLDRALLLFHSPLDQVVDIDEAAAIYGAAKHPKSFVSLDEADHLLSDAEDARYVGRVLAAWASRYLPHLQEVAAPSVEAVDRYVVARLDGGGFRTDIMADGHSLVADEPLAAGGTDHGPTPYGLLLAALGACQVMTLRMYAARKGWPLEAATVRLRHAREHIADCAEALERDCRIERIRIELAVEGDLDETQRARLVEIAGRCPVHRTLGAKVQLETTLAADAS